MKRFLLIATAVVLTLTGCTTSAPKVTTVHSMAALGDSISVASVSCGLQADCQANNWSTGTNTTVNSQAARINTDENTTITTNDDAVAGSKIADLAAQVQTAISQKPDYVTVLIGANDFCTPTVDTMTDTATFQSTFNQDIYTLTQALPNTKIFVSSLPDPNNLYAANKDNATANQAWAYAGICQSMLANPQDTSAAANTRRGQVHDRAVAFNTALQQTCTLYKQCHFDNDTVFNYKFKASDITQIDFFHPSIQGQQKLADLTWNAGGAAAFLAAQ